MAGVTKRGLHVVGDHKDRDAVVFVKLGDHLIQLPAGGRSQAGYRLVQQQHFLGRAKSPGQQHPLLLASRQLPITAPGKTLHIHTPEGLPGQVLFRPGVKGAQAAPALTAGKGHLPNCGGKVPLGLGLLGQIADFSGEHASAQDHGPLQGGQKAQDGPHQCGFPRSVLPQDVQIVSGVDGKAQIPDQDGIIAQGQALAVHLDHGIPLSAAQPSGFPGFVP